MVDSTKLFKACPVHGIPINVSNPEQALVEIEHLFNSKGNHYVCFFEGNLLARSLRERNVFDAISNATLIYPDGIIVSKEIEWQIKRPVSRVSGPTIILRACEYGVSRKWRHFFLGGGDCIAQRLATSLQQKYPGMVVAGCFTPPFREMTEEESQLLKEQIENSHADLLWVGLGGPKQEFWMQKNLGKINVPVMLGVGAAFDFHSGNRPWAPYFIRKNGLEWIWRMFLGGRKTFVRNVKCCKIIPMVCFDYIKYQFSNNNTLLHNTFPKEKPQ